MASVRTATGKACSELILVLDGTMLLSLSICISGVERQRMVVDSLFKLIKTISLSIPVVPLVLSVAYATVAASVVVVYADNNAQEQ